mmetsp:Transcript_23994/g.49074  ORF Transcript_23994/g.49074 Transcript_23994/m.49074 type:complete len:80 (-) Transcript_23994:809-1048(-)
MELNTRRERGLRKPVTPNEGWSSAGRDRKKFVAPMAAVGEYAPPGKARIVITMHVMRMPILPMSETGASAASDFKQLSG